MIQDELTNRKDLSRQQKYQMRHAANGLCWLCNKKVAYAKLCAEHAISQHKSRREQSGATKRYPKAKIYKLKKSTKRLASKQSK